jgi:hypothetical protein
MESWRKEAVWSPETFDQVLRVSSEAFGNLVRILSWTGARITTIVQFEARHYNKPQSRWDCEDLCRETGNKKVKHIRLLNDEARELVERLNIEHPEGPIFRNAYATPWDPDALTSSGSIPSLLVQSPGPGRPAGKAGSPAGEQPSGYTNGYPTRTGPRP